jgi:fused signal recognition particle receptor
VFFKRKKAPAADRPKKVDAESSTLANQPDNQLADQISVESDAAPGLDSTGQHDNQESVNSVQKGLNKSRQGFFTKIASLLSTNQLDDAYDDLEDTLLSSDIGVKAALSIVENLRLIARSKKIQSTEQLLELLAHETMEIMQPAEQQWPLNQKPYVIVVVGVNGVGKTTTTAKIAAHLQSEGKKVMLAAADTFRAAAVEQLQEWGSRLNIPVIAQGTGSDAAAVAHDAVTAAVARNVDVLLIDTAGRLHTQNELMAQLGKVIRVLSKQNSKYPHEVLQILDAGTGQNALSQVEHFKKVTNVSSLALTKLDGSAKGGVAIALTQKFGLPIRFLGVGEKVSDLKPFTAKSYIEGMFGVEALKAPPT